LCFFRKATESKGLTAEKAEGSPAASAMNLFLPGHDKLERLSLARNFSTL
jgi:hypothetical protein